MWIRSQDKARLVNTENLCICFDKDICSLSPIGNGESIRIWLGSYTTKEKALKVLDLIQKYVGGMQEKRIKKEAYEFYSITSKFDIPFNYCKDGIFQMPADNQI